MAEGNLLSDSEKVEVERIVGFLSDWARDNETPVELFGELAQAHSADLLTIPAASGTSLDSAYERAELLQKVEEAWNYQEPRPRRQVLLVPARFSRRQAKRKRKQSSKSRVQNLRKGNKNHAL